MVTEELCVGYTAGVIEGVQELLRRNWLPAHILHRALLPGLSLSNEMYQAGTAVMENVTLAADAFQQGLRLLQQAWPPAPATPHGRVMLAGVWGDWHTFGLDICALYLQRAGFAVANLGCNQREQQIITAVQHHQPDVLILTTTLSGTRRRIPVVIDALRDNGLRHSLYVLVGGGVLSVTDAEASGADGFCADWDTAVALVRQYLNQP